MSPTRLPLAEADRLAVRSTIRSSVTGIAAVALAAFAFATLDEGSQTVAAGPVPVHPLAMTDPISSVPSAAEALSAQPWRAEPEVVTSGG